MFPCYENTSAWDDFGEVVNPDDYVIKDEDMDQATIHVRFFYVIICLILLVWVLRVSLFFFSSVWLRIHFFWVLGFDIIIIAKKPT